MEEKLKVSDLVAISKEDYIATNNLIKVCGKCNLSKELICFYKHPRCKYGVTPVCKSCKSSKIIKNDTHKNCNKCKEDKLPSEFTKCANGYLGVRGGL